MKQSPSAAAAFSCGRGSLRPEAYGLAMAMPGRRAQYPVSYCSLRMVHENNSFYEQQLGC